jgi:TatD DNase family protein
VVHCFTGTLDEAKDWLQQGFYLSYSGIVTFKKSDALRATAHYAPLDRLFCETDSPFLSPSPHRGKPNCSSNVIYIYNQLAMLKNITTEALARQINLNFTQLYGIN